MMLVVLHVLASGRVKVQAYGKGFRYAIYYQSWGKLLRSHTIIPWLMTAASVRVR